MVWSPQGRGEGAFTREPVRPTQLERRGCGWSRAAGAAPLFGHVAGWPLGKLTRGALGVLYQDELSGTPTPVLPSRARASGSMPCRVPHAPRPCPHSLWPLLGACSPEMSQQQAWTNRLKTERGDPQAFRKYLPPWTHQPGWPCMAFLLGPLPRLGPSCPQASLPLHQSWACIQTGFQ